MKGRINQSEREEPLHNRAAQYQGMQHLESFANGFPTFKGDMECLRELPSNRHGCLLKVITLILLEQVEHGRLNQVNRGEHHQHGDYHDKRPETCKGHPRHRQRRLAQPGYVQTYQKQDTDACTEATEIDKERVDTLRGRPVETFDDLSVTLPALFGYVGVPPEFVRPSRSFLRRWNTMSPATP